MNDDIRLSQVLVALLQGVLYRDSDAASWQSLFELQARVRDYCATINGRPSRARSSCRAWSSGAS
jgi:hypothetical protein